MSPRGMCCRYSASVTLGHLTTTALSICKPTPLDLDHRYHWVSQRGSGLSLGRKLSLDSSAQQGVMQHIQASGSGAAADADAYDEDFEMEDDEGQEDEEILAADDGQGQSPATNKWDRIISALEDVLLNSGFEEARNSFCRQHCHHFEDTQENKLVYTELFQQYCSLVEGTIDAALKAAVPGFSMEEFVGMLEERQDELGAEVFDLLMSLSDFDTFKEVMLAHKREAEAGPQQQLLGLQCCAMAVHREEQEDGDERPDLDMSLSISPLVSPTNRGAQPPAGVPYS